MARDPFTVDLSFALQYTASSSPASETAAIGVSTAHDISFSVGGERPIMQAFRLDFNTQKTALETLQAESPKHRDAVRKLLPLNREALQFAEEGRDFDARNQFNFVEAVMAAIRDGRYENDFKKLWRR
jgi:hypothetical protein